MNVSVKKVMLFRISLIKLCVCTTKLSFKAVCDFSKMPFGFLAKTINCFKFEACRFLTVQA